MELEQNEKNVKDINKKRVMIHELSQFYDEWKSLEDHHYDLSVNYQKKHQKYEDILVKKWVKRNERTKFENHPWYW